VPQVKLVKTWYLEMREPIHRMPAGIPNVDIVRVRDMPVGDYLALYKEVGGPWNWSERLRLHPSELPAIIHDPLVEIYLLRVDGKVIGFSELDCLVLGEIELKYFGVTLSAIGCGLGRHFLNWVTSTVWSRQPVPSRFWLHTCEEDHPKALDFYLRGGFRVYDTKILQEKRI
jgi:hypothetical protein